MERRLLQLLAIFIGFLCMETNGYNLSDAAAKVHCIMSERDALLRFKQGFQNPSDLFSSWLMTEDCCKWKGVGCNNMTGHIISLDLHSEDPYNILQGELSASLLELPYLSHLDLSLNDFLQVPIPTFIGSFPHLEYLNLSNAKFSGTIPDHVGNLSHLASLDLSANDYSLRANNLDWLHGLSSLQTLNLGGVDLSNEVDWLDAINMLPFLKELRLYDCQLHNLPESLPHVNFTSLEILDLSDNSLNSRIPDWLFEIGHSLVKLYLSRNQLHGSVPHSFGNMSSLIVLDLSDNNLEGEIPTTLALVTEINQPREYSSLRELYLSRNQLNGSLEKSLVHLSELVVLDVAENFLEGVVTDTHLLNFTSLRVLDLSSNWLVFKASSSWIPVFQLENIGLRFCQLGPQFPKWLRSQKNIYSIDISNNEISDTVPKWFWNLSPRIEHMNLSFNFLVGEVPDLSLKLHLSTLDLSYNNLTGTLPHFPINMRELVLADNLFFGPISCLCEILRANNSLSYLNLYSNILSGELPDCWTYGQNLVILNLANNYLSGKIPESVGLLVHLETLRLDSNSLSGEIPESLKNCTSLFVFDLGKNRLSGDIPAWIGEKLSNLVILRLRFNAFVGFIPMQICQLKSLVVLDLSFNQISGAIPRFWNLSSRIEHMNLSFNFLVGEVPDLSLKLHLSTLDLSYNNLTGPLPHFPINVRELVLADNLFSGPISCLCEILRANNSLSYLNLYSNILSGELPDCWTYGQNLVILNLANNYLSGKIPESVGLLVHLETLRLDSNSLSGEIPESLKNCTSLFVFDLGKNRLSGDIPAWIGEKLSNLVILRLRFNAFVGFIPMQICQLKSLVVLDLSFNQISGAIPRCVNNFIEMTVWETAPSYSYDPYTAYIEYQKVTLKWVEFTEIELHPFMKLIDLSSNNLSGAIPWEITSLAGIDSLNLSRNNLTGIIPPNIGAMKNLESLDLSRNQLSCTIPTSMCYISNLGFLDLSYNKISGEIPNCGHLISFEATSYLNNHNLCGLPLPKICSGNESYEDPDCSNKEAEDKNDSIKESKHGLKIPSFDISMTLGFITGFWGFWGPLLFNRSWRHAYFRFLGNMNDKIYVIVVVNMARLRRKFQRELVPE